MDNPHAIDLQRTHLHILECGCCARCLFIMAEDSPNITMQPITTFEYMWPWFSCWCQCVMAQTSFGFLAGVSVLWYSPSLGGLAGVSVLWYSPSLGVLAGVSVL